MNIENLAPRLAKSFESCTRVSDTSDILRCERIYKDTSRSVYFFKAGSDVPNSDELSQIHQNIVGPSYFLAKDASRWNHYVVYVADNQGKTSPEFRAKCRQFEANKDYARKLVIFDSELDDFIDRSIKPTDAGGPSRTVVATWIEKLSAAGLSSLTTETARAPLVRAIRKGEANPAPRAAKVVTPSDQVQQSKPIAQIEKLTVQRFGARSISGTFDFGRVNLIRGPNGSGKTSLLEAIEYFYCNGTFRSNGEKEGLQAEATFTGLQKPVSFIEHANDYYQERDQRWYGRTINRGNRLWEGFSRFNFLNADAAVHFSNDDDQQNLTEALSKIALGPEAAFIWNRVEAFEQDILRELSPIESTLANLTRSISTAHAREAALKTSSPQVEAGLLRVLNSLTAMEWPEPSPGLNPPDAEWFYGFNPINEFVAAISNCAEIVSIDDIGRLAEVGVQDVFQLQELKQFAQAERQKRIDVSNARSSAQAQLTQLQRLTMFLDSGLLYWVEEERRLGAELGQLSQRLIPAADLEVLHQVIHDLDGQDELPSIFVSGVEARLVDAREKLRDMEATRAQLDRQLETIDSLISQIRSIGAEYVEHAPHEQECPLCRTRMSMDELLSRIQTASDRGAQATLMEKISIDMSTLQGMAKNLELALYTMRSVEDRFNEGLRPMSEAVENYRQILVNHQSLSSELAVARSQRETRERLGFAVSDLSELLFSVGAMIGQPEFSVVDKEQVNQKIAALTTEIARLSQDEAALQVAGGDTLAKLQGLLSRYGATTEGDVQRVINENQRKYGAIARTFELLPGGTRARFAGSLQTLAELCRNACAALDDLSAQLQAERARSKELDQLATQLAREQAQQSNVILERNHLQRALDVLQDIKKNHSLESGLSSFLKANLTSIQRVFSKIHAPQELSLSALDGGRLERFGHKRTVKLTQVSTGQRAALMLSVFLTLNMSLRQGPPQVLIDDPIAHIDDLNALSFLDYLADIAESGKRQIFFATANEKLANLFQKKMEFLGTDFRVIDANGKRE